MNKGHGGREERAGARLWALVKVASARLALCLVLVGAAAFHHQPVPTHGSLPASALVVATRAGMPTQVDEPPPTFPDQGITHLEAKGLRPNSEEAAALSAASPFLPTSSQTSSSGTAEFVAYWNDTHATNGKRDLQDIPAWLFVWPLTSYLDFGMGMATIDGTSTRASTPARYKDCRWVEVVDARSMTFLESFEECAHV